MRAGPSRALAICAHTARGGFELLGLVVRRVLEKHGRGEGITGGLKLYRHRRRLAIWSFRSAGTCEEVFLYFETRLFRGAMEVRAAIVAPTRGGKNRKP